MKQIIHYTIASFSPNGITERQNSNLVRFPSSSSPWSTLRTKEKEEEEEEKNPNSLCINRAEHRILSYISQLN